MFRADRNTFRHNLLVSISIYFAAFLAFVASTSVAGAQAAGDASAAGGAQPNPLMNLLPFGIMIAIMYFLMIRPQMNKQKQHQEFLGQLKRGDEVITSGGMLGRIEGLTDIFATLEIAPGVRIKILRSQIASSGADATAAAENKSEVKT
jgi:preprotein translocase subunit YajC